MLTSANTSRTGESVLEATAGQAIVHFEDLRLASRFLASEGEETDFIHLQIHFATNEAAGPSQAERPGLPEQDDLALGVASPQVDQAASGPFLQVEFPVGREDAAIRGGLDPRCPLLEQGSNVLVRMPLQVCQV